VGELLKRVNHPRDLKNFSLPDLEKLAQEIREEIIQTVSRTGGHLASSLGAVELILALHYIFDSPQDRLVWDVGHQTYAHKLLTGRKEEFANLRQLGGMSGFIRRGDSEHDCFSVGHSSTSISAALGIAEAIARKGQAGKVIAVIGDGALTAGMAFEALNQVGHLERNLIVVLNDNDWSIAPSVGAFSSFLSRKMTGSFFLSLRRTLKYYLRKIPVIGETLVAVIRKFEDALKGFITPGILFEALGFYYVGPILGHRMDRLLETFGNVKNWDGPVLVHVCTTKGKGYLPAEKNPEHFHGVGPFAVETGESQEKSKVPSYTEVFGKTLVDLAREDRRIVAITAAMPEGTGLNYFRETFPDRFYDVGIAEQHAVTFAAGLACEGLRPLVAIYSTFLQRAFDQILHDVCFQNLPVVFALDRAGIVGSDGPTHHGLFDLSYLRFIPNLVLMAPRDENELRRMLKTAFSLPGPAAIRFPRGKGLGADLEAEIGILPVGKAEVLREGSEVCLLAIGSTVPAALKAAEKLEAGDLRVTVVNARFAKPLDRALLEELSRRHRILVTVEDNVLGGGFGSAVLEELEIMGIRHLKVRRLGIPDEFVEHGPQDRLRSIYGIDANGIVEEVWALLKSAGNVSLSAKDKDLGMG